MSLRIAILALFAVVLTPTLAIAGLVVDSQVTGPERIASSSSTRWVERPFFLNCVGRGFRDEPDHGIR